MHCTIPSCHRPYYAKTFCRKHYDCHRNNGDPLYRQPNRPQTCVVDDCDRPVSGRGMCSLHYDRWRVHGDTNAVLRIIGNDEKRFWSKVNKNGPTMPHMDTPCWEWTGGKQYGYGRIRIKDTNVGAHQYSFFLQNNRYARPMTLHHCDNRSCVNPDHLREGTALDNSDDAIERGRQQHGERNGNSKLHEQDVLIIKGRLRQGDLQSAIAHDYGVSVKCINAIHTNTNWRRVAWPPERSKEHSATLHDNVTTITNEQETQYVKKHQACRQTGRFHIRIRCIQEASGKPGCRPVARS